MLLLKDNLNVLQGLRVLAHRVHSFTIARRAWQLSAKLICYVLSVHLQIACNSFSLLEVQYLLSNRNREDPRALIRQENFAETTHSLRTSLSLEDIARTSILGLILSRIQIQGNNDPIVRRFVFPALNLRARVSL
jgi:hypothetical protein